MSLQQLLKAEETAWVLGAAFLGIASVLAFLLLGWLGIGLLGLIGLTISTRIDLHGSHAISESGFGVDVTMYSKQLEAEKLLSTTEQKAAIASEKAKRTKSLYLVNTVFIAMIALGFGFFVLYQL